MLFAPLIFNWHQRQTLLHGMSALALFITLPALGAEPGVVSPIVVQHTTATIGTTPKPALTVAELALESITLQTPAMQASLSAQVYAVDLPTILKLIETQNLLLAQDKATVRYNRGLMHQKFALLLPDVQATYVQSKLTGGVQVVGGQPISVVRPTVQPQIALNWNIAAGEVFDALAARQRRNASQVQVRETLQFQLARASEEYYRLLAAVAARAALAQGIIDSQAQVTAAEAKFRLGSGTKYEWIRARTLVADQQRQLREADSTITLARQNLLNRLNLDPDVVLTPTELQSPDPSVAWTEARRLVPDTHPLPDLLTRAKAVHPSLARADLELRALGLDRKTILANIIPTVTVRTYLNGTGPTASQLQRTEFYGVTVSANLLTSLGLQIPTQLETKRAEIERRLLARQTTVRDIETQVSTAYLNSENFSAAIEAADVAIEAAEEGQRLAVGRYKSGYGTNLEVVDAEAALVNARTTRAQAVLNFNQAQIQLVEALGLADSQTLVKGVILEKQPLP